MLGILVNILEFSLKISYRFLRFVKKLQKDRKKEKLSKNGKAIVGHRWDANFDIRNKIENQYK